MITGHENPINLDSLTDAEILMLMSEDCKLNPQQHNKLSARLAAMARKMRGHTLIMRDVEEQKPDLTLLQGGKV